MSFHQAIVGAFYAAAKPLQAEDFGGVLLSSIGEQPSDQKEQLRNAAETARRDLGQLRERLATALDALRESLDAADPIYLMDLEKLVELASERASKEKSRYESLVRARSYMTMMNSRLGVASNEGAPAIASLLDEVEMLTADAADTFVRFYYELLALRAEIDCERVGQPISNAEELFAALNE